MTDKPGIGGEEFKIRLEKSWSLKKEEPVQVGTSKERTTNIAPPMKPEEAGINPPHLQRLRYNPDYYKPDEEDLVLGQDIVLGFYHSDGLGSPSIKWKETIVEMLPLKLYTGLVDWRVKK